jgi:hypothetical protein
MRKVYGLQSINLKSAKSKSKSLEKSSPKDFKNTKKFLSPKSKEN